MSYITGGVSVWKKNKEIKKEMSGELRMVILLTVFGTLGIIFYVVTERNYYHNLVSQIPNLNAPLNSQTIPLLEVNQ